MNNAREAFAQMAPESKSKLPENAKVLNISNLTIKNDEERLVYDSGDYVSFMWSKFQRRYLEALFKIENKFEIDALVSCVESLKNLKIALLKLGLFFESSAVLILFSKKNKDCVVRYVDFSSTPQPLGPGHLDGLDELISILSSIIEDNSPKK